MYRTYLEDRERFLSDIRAKMDKKLYDDVIVLAEARFKRFPGDMDAYLTVASCGAKIGRPVEAEEIVEQWHDIVRDQSRVYEVLGDAYSRKGMIKEAIESYMKFAALNPGTSVHISEKIASLQNIIIEEEDGGGDKPADMPADFHTITLARLYMKQGHFKMAGDVLGKILERDPENVEARRYAAHVECLMEKGWAPVIDELDRWLNGLQEKREQ
ncbi:MAG: hypothetical protein JRC90_03705 [Deltaproteobacteria bacterium]|nr:hypothetical protein [Deltaproteobacteria bacterium]